MTPFYFSIWLGNYSFSISSSQESHCSSSFHFKLNFSFNLVILAQFSAEFLSVDTKFLKLSPNFGQFFHSWHRMTPFLKGPHWMTPYFWTKSYTDRPLKSYFGRHRYVTFIFECPPRMQYTLLLLPVESLDSNFGNKLFWWWASM